MMKSDQYEFVNEGVASIVFACQDGDLTGRVIRIPKQPYRDPARDDQARQRITAIFGALFGREYILSEEMLLIPCAVLRTMMDAAREHRSSDRVALFDTGAIPESGSWPGWIMDDMTRIGSRALFTIELKPKWGFLLRPTEFKSSPIQSRICRNCLYQSLKHEQGRVQHVSRYCPLDLFHSDAGRRRRALAHLLETPQNNFVVFDGAGRCVSDAGRRPLPDADLIDLVGAVLTDHLALIGRIQGAQRLTNLTMGQVSDILDQIAPELWQQLVDDPLSADITERMTAAPGSFTLRDYPDCLRDASRLIAAAAANVPSDGDRGDAPVAVDNPVSMLRLLLLEMTARDVSLMMTFTADNGHPAAPTQAWHGAPPIRTIDCNGRRWRYKIAVVDLETKYPKKIRHWIDVENRMLAHFADQLARCQSETSQ